MRRVLDALEHPATLDKQANSSASSPFIPKPTRDGQRVAPRRQESGITTGRIGEPVAPRSLMQAPKKANS